jgi:hypothetical protein
MATTGIKRATKATCLSAARKRWGKRAFIRENKGSPSTAEREARDIKAAALKAEIAALDEKIKVLGNQWPRLLESAEFFLAVNGDEPSGSQFRAAVADARMAVDLIEIRAATRKQREELLSGAHRRKWDAGYVGSIGGLGDYLSIHSSADSLDELLDKIAGNQP